MVSLIVFVKMSHSLARRRVSCHLSVGLYDPPMGRCSARAASSITSSRATASWTPVVIVHVALPSTTLAVPEMQEYALPD